MGLRLSRLTRTRKTIVHLIVIAFIGYSLAHEGIATSDYGWLLLSVMSEVEFTHLDAINRPNRKRRK
jgi:hypothetical protein